MAFPQILQCLVCEGVRREIHGKFTVLGLYGVTPHVRIYIGDFSKLVTLCFFFIGTAGSGRFVINLRLRGPDGQVIVHDTPPAEGNLEANRFINFITMQFQGVLPSPGRYQVSLIDNTEVEHFPTTFELLEADAETRARLLT